MDMDLSEEQELLKKAARDFLEKECTPAIVRELEASDLGYSRSLWQEMAGLGWLGLPLPAEYGGSAMGSVDLVVLAKELGRVLCPSPYLSTVVFAGGAIATAGTDEQKQAYLPRIAAGEEVIAFAFQEEGGELHPSGLDARMETRDGALYLNGTKTLVEFANAADHLLVAANATAGLAAALVERDTVGVAMSRTPTMARDMRFRVDFKGAELSTGSLLGQEGQAWPLLEPVIQRGVVTFAAYALGAAEKMHEMTAEYARNRVQFGRPIGSFQLIQNYLAQLIIEIWGAETLVYYTAWALDTGLPARELVAKTKAFVGDVVKRTTDVGSQIFGGIGYIEDVDSTLYLRRGKQFQLLMGDTGYWEDIVADEVLKV